MRSPQPPVMDRRLAFLFAVTAAVAVGNLYWAQPLLALIAADLHVSAASAGWLVTTTQLGYAAGVLLIAPLGDVRDRRRLLPGVLFCCAAAGHSFLATGAAWLVILLAYATAAFAGRSVVLLLVAIVTLDVAFQATAILNQTRILATSHVAGSRLNTAFAVAAFTGGAAGSAAATTLWASGGWLAITTAGILASCAALAVWAIGRSKAHLATAPGHG